MLPFLLSAFCLGFVFLCVCRILYFCLAQHTQFVSTLIFTSQCFCVETLIAIVRAFPSPDTGSALLQLLP